MGKGVDIAVLHIPLILESAQGNACSEEKFMQESMKVKRQGIWGMCSESYRKTQAAVGICKVKERRMYLLAILKK